MRARNTFMLLSEPSVSVLVNLTEIRNGTDVTPATNTMAESSLPLYGVVLIAVIAAVLLALVVMAVVFVLCMLHSRYDQSKILVSKEQLDLAMTGLAIYLMGYLLLYS